MNERAPRAEPCEPGVRRPLIGIPAGSFGDPPHASAPMFRFNANYPAALADAGALPVAIPLDLSDDTLQDLLRRLDGLCLAGGGDVDPSHFDEKRRSTLAGVDHARDHTELRLARWALAADLPVLGICRGIQLLNVAAGGTLIQDIAAQVPGALRHDFKHTETPWELPTHRVRLAGESRLERLLGAGEIPTNSFHHQAVKRVAAGFRAVAWAEDGVIEGIEHPGMRFALAVQWHPEGMYRTDAAARRLFQAFVAAAR